MDQVRDIDEPSRKPASEESGEPHDEARGADNRHAPEDRQVIELLPIGPPLELRLLPFAEKPAVVRDKIPPVLQVRHHTVGTKKKTPKAFEADFAGIRVADLFAATPGFEQHRA